jgi:predicted NodU family carbamoyl transferase
MALSVPVVHGAEGDRSHRFRDLGLGATQRALQAILLQYARMAHRLTSRQRLVVSDGVFLNILANSEIAQSGLFEHYYAPSTPHDSGIAVGCAYAGLRNSRLRRAALRDHPTVGQARAEV